MILFIAFSMLLVIACSASLSQSVAIHTSVPNATPTSSPVSTEIPMITPTAAPTTTAIPVMANGQEPPPCTFPLAQIMPPISAPENYTFSNPKVVLTAPKGNFYAIAQWLPDNQQVLMTEALFSTTEKSGQDPQESISLFNPVTGMSKIYANRLVTYELPSWQAGLNAVVYPAMNFLGIDQNTHQPKFTRQIWISHGDPNAAQLLAENRPQLPLAVKPDGSKMLYLFDKQISGRDNALNSTPFVPFDPTQWDYAKSRRSALPVSYEMAWQPGTLMIFLYSEGANGGGGYTFILNADTGHICELNLGGWAEVARWSPNGRYLAIIRSTRYTFPTYSAVLTVLDTATGNLTTPVVILQEMAGEHYVEGIAWAPDNRHLLAIENILLPQTSQGVSITYQWLLYLVDSISGQSVNVEPAYQNFTSSPNNSLAWSTDGSKVVVHCPISPSIDKLCLISVNKTGK